MIKLSNNLLSAANAPHVEGIALIVVADEAIVEEHVPRVARIALVGSRRPEDVRPHIRKRMAAWKGRVRLRRINQGPQLLDSRKPPSAPAAQIQAVAIRK